MYIAKKFALIRTFDDDSEVSKPLSFSLGSMYSTADVGIPHKDSTPHVPS